MLKERCLSLGFSTNSESTRKEYPSIESNVADTSPRQPPSPLSHVPTHNTCNDYNSVSSGSISRPVTTAQQSSSSITQADLTIGSLRRKKDPAPQPPHFSPIQEKPSVCVSLDLYLLCIIAIGVSTKTTDFNCLCI